MRNLSLALVLLTAISLTVQGQHKPVKQQQAVPFVLGETQLIKSAVLKENRTLNIYLPEGYRAQDSTRYPVIYLLDGSANEDFIHIAGLVQFNSLAWVNQLPRSIVVGIANVNRKRDFTSVSAMETDRKMIPASGHSAEFITFIEQELQPYLSAHYKVNASKTLIGQSLGGLLAAQILLEKPQLFNKYIIISPSIWWNDGALLNQPSTVFTESFTSPTSVYIGVGKEGLGLSEKPRVMEVDANVLADKLKASKSKSLQVYFDYLPDENHATVTHQAVFNAFRIFNKNRIGS